MTSIDRRLALKGCFAGVAGLVAACDGNPPGSFGTEYSSGVGSPSLDPITSPQVETSKSAALTQPAPAVPPSVAPPPAAPPPASSPLATVWTPARESNGDVLTSEWESLPVMQWVEVGGASNRLADVLQSPGYPTSGGADDRESLTGPWCGAAWDAVRRRLILQGGGHGDGHMCSNGIYEVSLAKARCARLIDRSPRSAEQQYNAKTKVFEAWDANGSGYPNYAHPLKGGTPGSAHTYHGLVYLPPSTMQQLGYMSNVNGGLMTPMAVSVCNLDTGRYSVPYWATYGDGPGGVWDPGYQTNNLYGTKIVFPHSYYRHGAIDLTKPTLTRWSAEIGGTPSACTVALGIGDGPFVERAQKVMVKMPERGEYVSIAPPGKSQRVRYAAAMDARASDWTAYHDAITLTSRDGSHYDFSAANLDDVRGALLCSAGAAYDHGSGTIWIQGNLAGSSLYRINGIAGNTWNVERISATNPYGEQSGAMQNYNRFALGTFGQAKVLIRVTGVDHPIQIIRVA